MPGRACATLVQMKPHMPSMEMGAGARSRVSGSATAALLVFAVRLGFAGGASFVVYLESGYDQRAV